MRRPETKKRRPKFTLDFVGQCRYGGFYFNCWKVRFMYYRVKLVAPDVYELAYQVNQLIDTEESWITAYRQEGTLKGFQLIRSKINTHYKENNVRKHRKGAKRNRKRAPRKVNCELDYNRSNVF